VFSLGRKRARGIANRLGKAMVIARDACRGNDLQALTNVMESHDYARVDYSSNYGAAMVPICGWTEGSPEAPDMIYIVNSYLDANGSTTFRVTAEGSGRLAGLILIGGVGDIHVEVSDALKAMGELGADTLAVRRELLAFPGFSSMDQLLARLKG
jgi:hypothetical protein